MLIPKLRPLLLRASHILHPLLSRRLRLGTLLVPVYTLLLVLVLLILSVVFGVIHHKEVIRLGKLRSHHRYGGSVIDDVFFEGCTTPGVVSDGDGEGGRETQFKANASLVMLARNEEVDDVVKSMRSLERHFNQWYSYPWVFLNDVEFTEEFKIEVRRHTGAECHFGEISPEHWQFPQGVKDEENWSFKEGIETQGDRGIMYGSMESYHKMCRFYSGFFYKHPLVKQFEWYWRVEPDVEFFCDITYDPFEQMIKSGKKYGFTIMIKELFETIPNLFRHTKSFLKKQDIVPKSAWKLFVSNYKDHWKMSNVKKFDTYYKNMRYNIDVRDRARELILSEALVKKMGTQVDPLRTDRYLEEEQLDALVNLAKQRSRLPVLQGETMEDEDYNLYHFWSNFEIARVDLWDNPVYESYFQYLEEVGGFYTERWGDAPIHSLAVGFLLDINEVHYFRDVGYQHTTIRHCPANAANSQLPYRADDGYSPVKDPKFERFWSKVDPEESYGVGCRCRCPSAIEDIEDSGNDFLKGWFELTKAKKKAKKPVSIVKEEKKVRDALKLEGLIV